MNNDVRPSIRLPERAEQILSEREEKNLPKAHTFDSSMQQAIIEELDRLHAIIYKNHLS